MTAVETLPPFAPLKPSLSGPRPWRWSRDDYYRLGDEGFFRGKKVELIRGEIIEMSPVGWAHNAAVQTIADVLKPLFGGVGWVSVQGPVRFGDAEPLPDIAVFAGRIPDYTDHPTAAMLLVEVADTTLHYDLTTKAELYAQAGVPDYWVVDLTGRRLHLLRDPRPVAAGGHRYWSAAILTPTDAVTPLAAPAAVVRVADLLP